MKPFKCNNLDLNESEGVELNLTEFNIDGLSGVVVGIDVDEQTLQAYIGPNDIARMNEWLADWSRGVERDELREALATRTKERDQLARALSVRTKERDAAVSSANRLQAIVTSEALERYPPR